MQNCQWYGKPYWSIINPCDNCPMENEYKTIITIDGKPVFKEELTEEQIKKAMTNKSIFEITLEEKDKEIEQLNNIINEIEAIVYADISNIDCRISIQEKLDKLKELKKGEW